MTEFSSEIIFKNESYLKEDSDFDCHEDEPTYSDQTQRKCGEIILLANTKFWFVCAFCDERFHNIVIFLSHIKGIHITDAGNNTYIEDENPLDVPSHVNPLIIKFETDVGSGDCDSHIVETSNLISKPNCKESKEEHTFDGYQAISRSNEVINEIEEIILTQTEKTSEQSVNKHESTQSLPEDLPLAPKKIPKKRNRKKKVYSCPNCQHIARDKKTLDAHLQSTHETGTRHQCEECGKCFRSGNNLRSHLIIHSGTRPYKCDMCTSDFSHYNSLKMHRYIHTGERPHKCNQCDKGFVSSSGLKTHLREHTGEIPYVCEFCGRGFSTQCSYKRHMLSHSGRRAFECQECKKAFIHKETLRKHMVCHSNEKNFACDICSAKFTHKKNLVQHKKLHLNIKQYICKVCSKDFAQYAGLYSHMKFHKNKE